MEEKLFVSIKYDCGTFLLIASLKREANAADSGNEAVEKLQPFLNSTKQRSVT